MKTSNPSDPAKLRELSRALDRIMKREGGAALHARLRAAILQCVHSGSWVAGDRLPAETELIAVTGLSAGTVQRALRELTDQGVVRRQQGNGSFVASAPHRVDDVAHCRFLANDRRSVLPVFSRVLARRGAPATGPWQAWFPAEAKIVRLDRVLNVNDEFDVFNRFYFDGGRFPGMASTPVTELDGTNFRVLLAQEARQPPGGMSQTMRLVQARGAVARHMALSDGAWVAQVEIVRHIAGASQALYYQQMFVPPTAREFVTQDNA